MADAVSVAVGTGVGRALGCRRARRRLDAASGGGTSSILSDGGSTWNVAGAALRLGLEAML